MSPDSGLTVDFQTAPLHSITIHSGSPGVRLFVSWAVALACALCLSVPSGYSYGPALLFLAGIPLLLIKRPGVVWEFDDKWLLLALLYAFFIVILLNMIHAVPLSDYELSSRYVLAMLVLTLTLAFPPRPVFWWVGLIVGTVAGGVLAIWQVAVGTAERAEGFMISVQFGNLCLLMGFLCLAGMGWAQIQPRRRAWLLVLVAAATLGFTGSLLSGTRGGWLALPVGLAIIYLGYRRQMRRRVLAAGMALAMVVLAGLYMVPQTGVKARINMASVEMEEYFESNSAHTSVGVRFEMWRTALQLTDRYPLLGWGEEAYIQPMQALVRDIDSAPIIAQFTHVHNEVLDSLVKHGVVGLSGLLVIYLVPLWMFIRQLSPSRGGRQREVRAFALSGVLLVTCVMIFGLSQAFLRHNSGITVYLFFLVIIWTLLRDAQRRSGYLAGAEDGE